MKKFKNSSIENSGLGCSETNLFSFYQIHLRFIFVLTPHAQTNIFKVGPSLCLSQVQLYLQLLQSQQ